MSELVKVPYRTVHTLLIAGMRRVLTFQSPEMKLWATMALELCLIEEKLLGTLDTEHGKRLEARGWALLVDGVPYSTKRYATPEEAGSSRKGTRGRSSHGRVTKNSVFSLRRSWSMALQVEALSVEVNA